MPGTELKEDSHGLILDNTGYCIEARLEWNWGAYCYFKIMVIAKETLLSEREKETRCTDKENSSACSFVTHFIFSDSPMR